jgi:hypothetical protein
MLLGALESDSLFPKCQQKRLTRFNIFRSFKAGDPVFPLLSQGSELKDIAGGSARKRRWGQHCIFLKSR